MHIWCNKCQTFYRSFPHKKWFSKYKHTHTHPFNSPLSRTIRLSWYRKGKTNPDFTEARDSEWQWHQLGHMQLCISLQADNHASTQPLRFLQAGCPSCHPTNIVKALKAKAIKIFVDDVVCLSGLRSDWLASDLSHCPYFTAAWLIKTLWYAS